MIFSAQTVLLCVRLCKLILISKVCLFRFTAQYSLWILFFDIESLDFFPPFPNVNMQFIFLLNLDGEKHNHHNNNHNHHNHQHQSHHLTSSTSPISYDYVSPGDVSTFTSNNFETMNNSHVTAQIGGTAILPCIVDSSSPATVTWIRRSDYQLLTGLYKTPSEFMDT